VKFKPAELDEVQTGANNTQRAVAQMVDRGVAPQFVRTRAVPQADGTYRVAHL
jgi:hypothetical protein